MPLIMAIAVLETSTWTESPEKEPGNFGDPLGLDQYTEEMRTKELNNGRMAMISVLGIFAAEVMTGKDAIEQFGLSALPKNARVGSTASSFAGASYSSCPARVEKTTRHFFGAPKAEEPPAPPPFSPAAQVGAIAPLGYFDPLGYCPEGDEETFRQFRAQELKHGRVAMMASVGAVMQHFVKLPIFNEVKGTFGAFVQPEGVMYSLPLVMAIAVLETSTWTESPEKEPGNFGDPLGLDQYTEEMRTKELNNGRMAMISVLGIFAAEVLTGKDAIEQFGLFALPKNGRPGSTASSFAGASHSSCPVRVEKTTRHFFAAPKAEEPPAPPPFSPAVQVGAIAPLGYFDPLGYCQEGDEETFRQFRAQELKHGRVAMMASIGAVVQHFV
jgi:hypothetical protein